MAQKIQKEAYLVLNVVTETPIIDPISKVTGVIDVKWADGMIGAVPVFETKEQADAYADGKADVVKLLYYVDIETEEDKKMKIRGN